MSGSGLDSVISRKISAKRFLGTAASAISKDGSKTGQITSYKNRTDDELATLSAPCLPRPADRGRFTSKRDAIWPMSDYTISRRTAHPQKGSRE
jgi:hypothetical protein